MGLDSTLLRTMDTIHGITTCHSEFALLFQLFRYGLVRWQIRQIQIYVV